MSELWIAVAVAAVPVIGGGIGYLFKYLTDFREENKKDHDVVMDALMDLRTDVREVKMGLYDHITWHVKKGKK